jgi:hypothetical protein
MWECNNAAEILQINRKSTPASREVAQILYPAWKLQSRESVALARGYTSDWPMDESLFWTDRSHVASGSFQWLFPGRAVPWRSFWNCAFNAGSPLGTYSPAVTELGQLLAVSFAHCLHLPLSAFRRLII